jgi:hypothetical protein
VNRRTGQGNVGEDSSSSASSGVQTADPPATERQRGLRLPPRERVRTTIRDLLRGEHAEELELEFDSAAKRVFRSRVALAIVVVSILSALAGWRASVFEERASNAGAVFHQDLLLQQRLERQHEGDVARDIGQFTEFEQHWFLAHALRHAAAAGGASAALAGMGQQEAVAADQALHNFSVIPPHSVPDGTSSYDAAAAYRQDAVGDVELEGLHPREVLENSDALRSRAVNMTGVAALFIAALVVLTLAQVTLGRRGRVPGSTAAEQKDNWSISHTLLAAATLVTLIGCGLFVTVMLQ